MECEALTQEVLQAMLQLYRTAVQRKINEVSQGELYVLNFLARGGGRALSGELSAAMGVSSARMAAAVNSLERKGDVVRAPDETDRRRVQVVLTDAGKERLLACQKQAKRKLGRVLSELGEADVREFLRIIRRLTAIAEADQRADSEPRKTSEGEKEC